MILEPRSLSKSSLNFLSGFFFNLIYDFEIFIYLFKYFSPNTKNVLAESLLKQSHSRLGGVIPTIAMKRHAQALPKVVNEVLEKVPIENIDAVAVTNRPGLNGSLVMGRNYAQYLCYKYRKRK